LGLEGEDAGGNAVKKLLQVALGIIAAIGGFVDIGELVFNTQAGADFRYQLLWAVPVGVIGIVVFAEMTGRIATVSGRPIFDVVRMRMGLNVALVTLVASLLINLITLAAEVGGAAIALQLLFDLNVSTLILLAVVALILIVYFVPFGGIERIFGYLGCGLLVYVGAAVHLKPNWHQLASGLLPSWHSSALYAYFVVGVIGAALSRTRSTSTPPARSRSAGKLAISISIAPTPSWASCSAASCRLP
jgi:manganese transport protein